MIRYLKPVRPSAARGMVAEVYAQIRRDFGTLGEPLTLHSPIPGLLASVWSSFKECFVAGPVRRDLREAVAVTVSRLNRCPYCIDAHTVMLRAAAAHSAASFIQYGREREIEDRLMRLVVEWAAATRTPGAPALLAAPFFPDEAPQFIGAAVWTHYINRVTQVFLSPRLLPFKSGRLGLRTAAERMGGLYFSRYVQRPAMAGTTGGLLNDAPLPEDLAWAAPSRAIARSFAAFAAAAEEAGRRALAPEIRACVLEELDCWKGEDRGLTQDWLDKALERLDGELRPAARLAFLGAFAPYRIGAQSITEFRADGSGSERLLGCLAWAGFSAARMIGQWLSVPDGFGTRPASPDR